MLRVAYSQIPHEEADIKERYFCSQPHARLRDYISRIRSSLSMVTTHDMSPVPSLAALKREASCADMPASAISAHRVGDFDSEREFEAEVRRFGSDESSRLLIVQCRAGDLQLLTCAKYIVQSNSIGATRGKHVLFVVHLPQRSASHNYTVAVDGWEALHCDCLLPPDDRHPLDATHLAMTPMRLSEIISGTGAIGVEAVSYTHLTLPTIHLV